MARAVPMKIQRRDSFSVTNASRSEAKLTYGKLNIQTPCPPRGAASPHIAPCGGGSRLTQGPGWEFFTQHARIAFGDGCDCPDYVISRISTSLPGAKPESAPEGRPVQFLPAGPRNPVNGIPLTVVRTFDDTGNQSLPGYCLPICQRCNATWRVTAVTVVTVVTVVTAPKWPPEKNFLPPSPHAPRLNPPTLPGARRL